MNTKVFKTLSVSLIALTMGLSACGPKKTPKKLKAPSESTFKTHMKTAGFESDDKLVLEEAMTEISLIKVASGEGFKVSLNGKIDKEKAKLPEGVLASEDGAVSATATVAKPETKTEAKATGVENQASLKVTVVCSEKCNYATAFLELTYKDGEGKDQALKGGFGFDFKNGDSAEKPSHKSKTAGAEKKEEKK